MQHQEITKAIIGCAFEVSNELGPGFLESVYETSTDVGLLINFGNPKLEHKRFTRRPAESEPESEQRPPGSSEEECAGP